ncbi:hypothetical protein CYMTET_2921 [Cymbomonas tetramitiformis]|uniref:EF-hand domain-containing protein n=1 Tax=Cymbomonas tetramitiformis TaxID=36881 RepID=A0AAE0LLC6_9CHLO|nr:hypothetical protein CYMTET_2921 [Cymbomonas tetramitiformis]
MHATATCIFVALSLATTAPLAGARWLDSDASSIAEEYPVEWSEDVSSNCFDTHIDSPSRKQLRTVFVADSATDFIETYYTKKIGRFTADTPPVYDTVAFSKAFPALRTLARLADRDGTNTLDASELENLAIAVLHEFFAEDDR